MMRFKVFFKDQWKRNSRIIKDSAAIFIGSMIANVFGYLYQLYMSRSLDPVGFGVLGSLFSFIYIFSAIASTIQLTLTHFAARLKAKDDFSRLKKLFIDSFIVNLVFAVVIALIFGVFSVQIGKFLNIDFFVPIILLGIFIGVSFLQAVIIGIITGMQKFYTVSFFTVLSSGLKLLFGIALVGFGYWVSGAMLALVLSIVIALVVVAFSLRSLLDAKKHSVSYPPIFRYAFPVFIFGVCANLLINVDMILVKHYFSGELAGFYASAGIIAKIILFASTPIVTVMFPTIAEKHEKRESTSRVLCLTVLMTGFISFCIVCAYFLFPNLIIRILVGSKYDISQLIGLYGLMMALYALVSIFFQYNLAVHRYNFLYFTAATIILEVVLITLFHTSLLQVISLVALVAALNLVFFLWYNRLELAGIRNIFLVK